MNRRPRHRALEHLHSRLMLANSELLSPGWRHAADADADFVAISDDGRYTFFRTAATNLDPLDTDKLEDLYRYDRSGKQVERIPTRDIGLGIIFQKMSADGQKLLFASEYTETVFGDPYIRSRLQLYDIPTRTLLRVTPNRLEYDEPDNDDPMSYDISADGLTVAYSTRARNVVPDDTNRHSDVFLWSHVNQETTLVSRPNPVDGQGNGASYGVFLTEDARYALFTSKATNLASANYLADTNVFRADLTRHTFDLISRRPGSNDSLNQPSSAAAFSDYGDAAFFESSATNTGLTSATGRYVWRQATDGLTSLPAGSGSLQFDVTGMKAAYEVAPNQWTFSVQVANLITGDVRQVASSIGDFLIGWSVTNDLRYLKLDTYFGGNGYGYSSTIWNLATNAGIPSYIGGAFAKNTPVVAFGRDKKPQGVRESIPETTTFDFGFLTTYHQVYVQEMGSPKPDLASIDSTPDPWPMDTRRPRVSNNGRYVLYDRTTPTAAIPDQSVPGPMVYDRVTDSMAPIGITALDSVLSPDGRYVLVRQIVPDSKPAYSTYWSYEIATKVAKPVISDSQGRPIQIGLAGTAYSPDGRYLFFYAANKDLIAGDVSNQWSTFRMDTQSRDIDLVSVVVGSQIPANQFITDLQTSLDGRFVVFLTESTNMYPDDRNGVADLFVRDMQNRTTTLISRNAFVARTANGRSYNPRISLDGSRVVFDSDASNLVVTDTNGFRDVFSYDVESKELILISVASNGSQANADSQYPSITSDGNRIAYASAATNLTAGAGDTSWRIYYRDLPESKVTLLPGDPHGIAATLSPSGRLITVWTGQTYFITETEPASSAERLILPLPDISNFDLRSDGNEFSVSLDESTVVYTQIVPTDVQNAYNVDPLTGDKGTHRSVFAVRLNDVFPRAPKVFRAGTTFDSGPESNDVDLADLNGDGLLDAFFTNYTPLGHRIFWGDGNGGFTDSEQRLTGAASFYSALGDLDGDGDIDAFIPTLASDSVWFNDGRGIFTNSGQRLGNDRSIDVALGDLDGDGDLDAYVANFEAKPDRIWLNDGSGQFTDSGQELGDTWSKGVELGDVDGDGDLDALVANGTNRGGEPNRVWLNDGRARFTDSGQRLGNSQSQHGALGDVDGDGDLDAVFANSTNLQEPNDLWLNDGKGHFTDSGQRLGNEATSHVAFADFDGDQDLDLFTANWLAQPSEVWFNDGRGIFTRGADRLGLSQGSHVAIGDLNRDGHLDALLANTDSKAELYLNGDEPWDADVAPNRVVEKSGAWTPVGITLRVLKLNESERISYRLRDDVGGRFMVDASTGVVTVKDGSLLDTQQATQHSIVAVAESSERGSFLRSFSVSVVSPYQPLQARPDAYSTQDGVELIAPTALGLLANDTIDSTATAIVSSSDSRTLLGIRVVVESDGAIRYDARQQAVLQAIPQGASLEDRFQYTATSSRKESSSAYVTITVAGVNDAPQANQDTLEVLESTPAIDISQLLLENDTDPDMNGKDKLRVMAVHATSALGIVELRGNRVWYQAGPAFRPLKIGETAEDQLQYTIEDEHGATSLASVIIRVQGTSNRPSDLNGDDVVDQADLEELCLAVRGGSGEARYDVNQDGSVGDSDVDLYLSGTLRSTHGDANLDSAFDSSDLVLAFQSGRYEAPATGSATWSTGDWNCDGEFNSSDLVRAFQSGSYTQNNVIHVRPGLAPECSQADRFCSVQKAVDAASPGDSVLVWPGTYAPFTVRRQEITIRAVDRDATEVLIDGDLSGDPTSAGVTLLADHLRVEGLTAINSASGFRVEGTDTILWRNTARDNLAGFWVGGHANTLERNRAISNRRDGFFLTSNSSEATMLLNEASNNGRHGYWLAGTGDVITHNRAAGNQVGFLLAGRTLSLQNNEASTNRQAGFLLETGGHTLTSNLSKSNELDGFWAMPSAGRSRYDGNQASGNGGAGFRLDSSLEMLVGNQSTTNAAEGFLLSGASHVVSANTAVENRSHGFSVLLTGSRLYRNFSRKNNGWGFRLERGGNTLVENTAEDNQRGDIGWE